MFAAGGLLAIGSVTVTQSITTMAHTITALTALERVELQDRRNRLLNDGRPVHTTGGGRLDEPASGPVDALMGVARRHGLDWLSGLLQRIINRSGA